MVPKTGGNSTLKIPVLIGELQLCIIEAGKLQFVNYVETSGKTGGTCR